jgi:tRNA G18 (ribose-2'-O)-methylase SpoU
MLDGAKYPVNIGFCIRTAEVSGADAVIVDGPLNNQERSAAKRASMKSHRFIPVFWRDAIGSIKAAKDESNTHVQESTSSWGFHESIR